MVSAFTEALALTEKDPSAGAQLLLGLISEASQGRDISSAARDIIVVSPLRSQRDRSERESAEPTRTDLENYLPGAP